VRDGQLVGAELAMIMDSHQKHARNLQS
jgi:hypothetical protein